MFLVCLCFLNFFSDRCLILTSILSHFFAAQQIRLFFIFGKKTTPR